MNIDELLEVIGPDMQFHATTEDNDHLDEKMEAVKKLVERNGYKCSITYTECPKCKERIGFLAVLGENKWMNY